MSLFTRRRSAQKTIIAIASSAAIPSRTRVGGVGGVGLGWPVICGAG
jgi:hypothetical protein